MNTSIKKTFIPFIITIIMAVLMVVSMFLPYSTAVGDHRERLERAAEYSQDEIELGMTAEDLMDISMLDYAKTYLSYGEQIMGSTSFVYVALFAIVALFALMSLLFAILKKPIPGIVFGLLTLVFYYIHNWDYQDRGVISGLNYDWGIGHYLLYVAIVLYLIAAVWMIIAKKNEKNQITE